MTKTRKCLDCGAVEAHPRLCRYYRNGSGVEYRCEPCWLDHDLNGEAAVLALTQDYDETELAMILAARHGKSVRWKSRGFAYA